MKHDCKMGRIQVEEREDGVLYIKADNGFPPTISHRVDFCPVCGYKSTNSFAEKFAIFARESGRNSGKNIPHMADIHSIPIPDSFDLVGWYREQWEKKVDELNTNIEVIKTYMSAQNTQNECFMDRDLHTSQEISKLKTRIENLEKGFLNDKTE